MARQFTREEFYELVWSKPMTHLAKNFALSDVAFHKICRKHDVPNPSLGWWAKKAAGQKVKQTPLPRPKPGTATTITIAAGELRQEPDVIAVARENARILASSVAHQETPPSDPIVGRTVGHLRKAKPADPAGLVSVEGTGLIKCQLAPASIDRFELALNRIVAAATAIGVELVRGENAATFLCDGETIGFSVTEAVRREKHIPTEKEKADRETWQRKQAKRWQRDSWDDIGTRFSGPQIPEWDVNPTVIDETIAEAAQLDLVAVLRARQLRRRNMRSVETLGELLFELVPGLRIELAPFLQRGIQKPQLIGHEARS